MFVFSGIMPICRDEDGMAAVLGHEVSHNFAHHVGEKISKSFILSLAAIALSLFFDVSGQSANALLSILLEMPNSRKQEVCENSIKEHVTVQWADTGFRMKQTIWVFVWQT